MRILAALPMLRRYPLLVLVCGVLAVYPTAGTADGKSDPDAGGRMYREGIRPSGEPLGSTVSGDVAALGTQFTCRHCHGRSGMGAAEGSYFVPPIAGRLLFAEALRPKRSAYDLTSLARALREGRDPDGRPLNPLMPRFQVSDEEVADLAAYLAGLSTGTSPGIDDKTIHLATVVTDEVDPGLRDAVLAVLNTYVEEKNRQTRLESKRPDRSLTPSNLIPSFYHEWEFDVWTLHGPRADWREQLEQHYRRAPVFALLGGVGTGSWSPIGRFCEDHELPCLFPATDLPGAGAQDSHTLYFSSGLELEADIIAGHLKEHPVASVMQVFCDETAAMAAKRLHAELNRQGVVVRETAFSCKDSPPVMDTRDRAEAAVLWVPRDRLAGIAQQLQPESLYLSSTLLDRQLEDLPLDRQKSVYIAHPYRLPGEPDPALRRFIAWAKTRHIEIAYPRQQSEAYFACLAANDSLTHIRRFLIRDYMLDMLDHAQGLAGYLPVYARPTLGPGQRYLTKGGYVLRVVDGTADSTHVEWVRP